MTWNNVFCNTFKALSEELGLPPADKSLVLMRLNAIVLARARTASLSSG